MENPVLISQPQSLRPLPFKTVPFLPNKSNQRPQPSTATTTPLTHCLNADLQEAIAALERGSPISPAAYISLLRSCIDSGSIDHGRRLHASLPSVRDRNAFVDTKLVSMYAKLGSLADARRVFDQMPERNLFSWSAIIGAYVREHRWCDVLPLFFRMMREGDAVPDGLLLTKILQACANAGDLEAGRLLHSLAIRTGLLGSTYVSNTMLAMYAKCGELDMATRFFETMGRRNAVSWNSIIFGHCQRGDHDAALRIFERMRAEGIEPNVHTRNILIASYNQSGNPDLAMELMERTKSSGLEPDVFTWTSMISGLAQNHRMDEALDLFQEMQLSGVNPNGMTIASAIHVCASLQALSKGKELHSYAVKTGNAHSILVGNSLINVYARCGALEDAQRIFDEMPERDVVTWNSMVGGYARAGYCGKAYNLFSKMESTGVRRNVVTWNAMISGFIQHGDEDQAIELLHMMEMEGIRRSTGTWNSLISGSLQNGDANRAFRIFRQMQAAPVRPNFVTILSLLPACANLLSSSKLKEVHCCILRYDFQRDVWVANALIDTYSKSGDIVSARAVFNGLSSRNLVSWNSMIAGLVLHGYSHDAQELFHQMKQAGMKPNKGTFASVINACALDGMVNEGKKLFSSMMEDYQPSPRLEHYVEMVNLLGRSGRLREASDFIEDMPVEPDASVWDALLTAARIYGNLTIANHAAAYLFELEPGKPEIVRLLSHTQALYGYSNNVPKVRNKESQFDDSHGCCWMEVKHKVITFLTGSQLTLSSESKLAKFNSIVDKKDVALGFADTMLEIEEEREEIVGTHSEKLALAFGLVNLPASRAIRIVKSVRICKDCHTTSKLISKEYKREILIKDPKTLHHFKDGICSCKDYW